MKQILMAGNTFGKHAVFMIALLFAVISCKKESTHLTAAFQSATEIFKTVNKADLKNPLTSQMAVDETAKKLSVYLKAKYNIDTDMLTTNSAGIFITGMYLAAYEKGLIPKANIAGKMPAENSGLHCFISAITGLIGIKEAVALVAGFTEGAIATSALAALKLIGGRVAVSVGVVFALYEAGECLNLW
jgi:hypothetical protein